MVVMAVREAEAEHRAAPLWVNVLLAAAFAVTGWLVAGLFGGLAASADETPQGDHHPPAETKHHHAAPHQSGLLGGLLDTTLTTLVSTVDQVTATVTTTVNTTVSTVTSTVDTVTTTVTTTANAVVQPVTSTLVAPVTTATKQQETTAATQTRSETVSPEPAPVVAPALPPAPVPAQPATLGPQQAVKHKQPRPAAHPQATVSEQVLQAKDTQPTPLPSSPGGPSCTAVAAHDGGSNTKHPLAILGAGTGVAQLASIGIPRRHAQVDNSRDAALPTTSPD
jgi:hypothetical protein